VDDVLEKRVFMLEISSAQGRPVAPILSGNCFIGCNWLLCIIFLSQKLFNLGDGGVEGNDVCSGLAALSVWHTRMRVINPIGFSSQLEGIGDRLVQ
jgi:hypothetical protein